MKILFMIVMYIYKGVDMCMRVLRIFQFFRVIDNVGDVNTHLKMSVSDEQSNRETLASTLLVFMIRGIFSTIQYPYAQFPCSTLSSDQPFLGGCCQTGRIGFLSNGSLLLWSSSQ